MIAEALYNYLNTQLTTPVYYVNADKTAPPVRIVFTPITDIRQYDTGLRRARIQTSVWHTNKYQGEVLREQVYDALQRFKGRMGGVAVLAIAHNNSGVLTEVTQDTQTELYQFITDYFITYKGE